MVRAPRIAETGIDPQGAATRSAFGAISCTLFTGFSEVNCSALAKFGPAEGAAAKEAALPVIARELHPLTVADDSKFLSTLQTPKRNFPPVSQLPLGEASSGAVDKSLAP
jgi:hypothetical protein